MTEGNPVAAIVAGGTVSAITGGKFANGALTAAYGYLFNCLSNVEVCVSNGGGNNRNDVRGGFNGKGESLVYHPDNYDPDAASKILLGAALAVAPEVGLAARAGGAATSVIQILEREGNVVIASFKVANGEARVAAEMVRDGDRLILKGAHIEGNGTLKEALSAAKSFGREQGVKEVVIQGGVRTTGASPGHLPRPISIKTGL
jgi:hypothetical protein